MEIERGASGVAFRVVDYHGDPLHLADRHLAAVGVRVVSICVRRSDAERWAGDLEHHPDAYARGPALLEPQWSAPEGVEVGGVLFVRVRGGIDLYVTDYHCGRVLLDERQLERLGLRLE